MINIVIVDDEELIRRGLTKILNELGNTKVVGEACNGYDALKIVKKIKPDVVITDIMMPKMNGMEFIKILNLKFPNVRKIVLSDLDDSKCTRQAIREGVLEYLLKPIDVDQLNEILTKIDKQIDLDKKKRKDEALLKTMVFNSMPLLKERCVLELIGDNDYSKKDILKKLNSINIDIKGEYYKVLIISIDNYKVVSQKFGNKDISQTLLSMCNIAENSILKSLKFMSCFNENRLVFILSSMIEKTFEDVINQIFQDITNYIDFRITISAGMTVEKITSIHQSYNSALRALEHRFYNKGSAIIQYDKLDKNNSSESDKEISFDSIQRIEKEFKKSIEVGNYDDALSFIELFYSSLSERRASPDEAMECFVAMFLRVEKDNPEIKNTICKIFGDEFSYIKALCKIDVFDEMIKFNDKFYKDIFVYLSSKKKNGHSKLVGVVKEYVEMNYKENITLSKISELTYVNSNYFCGVFKTQTGENFVDFVTRVRIEKAKTFLKDLRIKTYEVSRMVGYEDPTYFSKVFKKVVGISPSEYKNI